MHKQKKFKYSEGPLPDVSQLPVVTLFAFNLTVGESSCISKLEPNASLIARAPNYLPPLASWNTSYYRMDVTLTELGEGRLNSRLPEEGGGYGKWRQAVVAYG